LRQVFGLLSGVTGSTQIGVDWAPINAAQLRHSFLCSRRRCCSGSEHNAPGGFCETFVCVGGRMEHGHARILRTKQLSCKAPVAVPASALLPPINVRVVAL